MLFTGSISDKDITINLCRPGTCLLRNSPEGAAKPPVYCIVNNDPDVPYWVKDAFPCCKKWKKGCVIARDMD